MLATIACECTKDGEPPESVGIGVGVALAMFSKPAVVLVLDNLSHSATAFSPVLKV